MFYGRGHELILEGSLEGVSFVDMSYVNGIRGNNDEILRECVVSHVSCVCNW